MAAGTAALLASIIPAVLSFGGGVLKSKSAQSAEQRKNKQDEKMATIDRTATGFTDLGSSLADPVVDPFNFSLKNKKTTPFTGGNMGGF